MSFYVLYINEALYLSFNIFNLHQLPLSVSFYLDWISTSFITAVVLIRCVIIVYSYNYISPYSKSGYFLWLTFFFVLSMLLVVTISNLFYMMLGWDGLGLVSFFLIVYYQNQSSITSGIFTLLINRIGDCFFLVAIVLIVYTRRELFSFGSAARTVSLILILAITFITKRAIYPFSPWLPLAIAAPTPISALVHSSTLVTAGLYLIMRYSYILYLSPLVIKILLIASLFTSFYAGVNAIFETDLKKLIALSTLSHLGFIGLAFSVGLVHLAFFHILAHALFKSLLFMTMGDIMINLNHSQDIRFLSSGIQHTPLSCGIMYISLFNLLGLPNVSGFFSKDLVLEILNYSNISSIMVVVVFINVAFTYFYTYQLFYYSFQSNKLSPYKNFHSLGLLHTLLISLLAFASLFYGFYFLKVVYGVVLYYPVPTLVKYLPVLINGLIFSSLFLFGKQITVRSSITHYYFSNIIYLTNLILSLASNAYYSVLYPAVQTVELGALNYRVNGYLSQVLAYSSHTAVKLMSTPSLQTVLYLSLFLLFAALFL